MKTSKNQRRKKEKKCITTRMPEAFGEQGTQGHSDLEISGYVCSLSQQECVLRGRKLFVSTNLCVHHSRPSKVPFLSPFITFL